MLLFSSQDNPDDHSSATGATRDLFEETATDVSGKSKGDLTKIIELCDENGGDKEQEHHAKGAQCIDKSKDSPNKLENSSKNKEENERTAATCATKSPEIITIEESATKDTKEASKTFDCSQCVKKFTTKNELDNHIKTNSISALKESYKFCRHCGLKMPESALENHELIHSGNENLPPKTD